MFVCDAQLYHGNKCIKIVNCYVITGSVFVRRRFQQRKEILTRNLVCGLLSHLDFDQKCNESVMRRVFLFLIIVSLSLFLPLLRLDCSTFNFRVFGYLSGLYVNWNQMGQKWNSNETQLGVDFLCWFKSFNNWSIQALNNS